MKVKNILIALIIFNGSSLIVNAQPDNEVIVVGEMKNVMWKGQLFANINLDTIANKTNLYGLGPLEYLAGEILIIDGKSYQSTVISNDKMKVEETFTIKAPFFGYANISKWEEKILPDSILTTQQLEEYINQETKQSKRPFMFKLNGKIDNAKIHIVNLPKGSKVSSPKQAHEGLINYYLTNEKVDIVGFFSTEHQTIFTHHDTYLHMHLITSDRQKMGHLDEVLFKKGEMKLYLPIE